eukprot:82233_1
MCEDEIHVITPLLVPFDIGYYGRGSGIKTGIQNIKQIGTNLNINPHYIMKYFGYTLGASAKFDEKQQIGFILGRYTAYDLQNSLKTFVNQFVLCQNCNTPTTQLYVSQTLFQQCNKCSSNTEISGNGKLIKYISKHMLQILHKEMIATFLKGCINCHNNELNVMLLFSGYIRMIIQGTNAFIPDAIIDLCISFCYSVDLLYKDDGKDKWIVCDRESLINHDASSECKDNVYYDYYTRKWKPYDNDGLTVFLKQRRTGIKLDIGKEEAPFILKTNSLSIGKIRKVWNVQISTNKSDTIKVHASVVCDNEESNDQNQCEIETDRTQFLLAVLFLAVHENHIRCVVNVKGPDQEKPMKRFKWSIENVEKGDKYCLQLTIHNSCIVDLL